jgi:hypothetical protein
MIAQKSADGLDDRAGAPRRRHGRRPGPGPFLAVLAVLAAPLAGSVPAIRAGRTAPAESLRLPG